MALTSRQKDRRDIPGEPGEWMEIRRLSWKQLEDNSDAESRATLINMKDMGAELIAGVRSAVASRPAESVAKAVAEAAADPLKDYDLGILLRDGIVAWSYDAPVTREAVEDLDPTTARWAGEWIVEFAKGIRTEQEQGEG